MFKRRLFASWQSVLPFVLLPRRLLPRRRLPRCLAVLRVPALFFAALFLGTLGLAPAPAWAQAETAAAGVSAERPPAAPEHVAGADGAEAGSEKILVVGSRPGPGLWKVVKGDHVLWVFGMYAPLPKNMAWRAQQVEAILAQSQQYLPPPSATAAVGFFRSLTLLPYVIGLKKSPDGARLSEVLPADVYARWLLLKKKYLGDDDGIERERPIFAAEELFQKALLQVGLSSGKEVRRAIEKIVKQHNIKTTPSEVQLAMDDPVKMIKDFKKFPLDDVACFSTTLARLETDLDAMRVRANAWAKGDLQAIQKLSYADREEACGAAFKNSAFVKGQPGFQLLEGRIQDVWLANAEKALATNASTFALLPIKDILDPKGVMAALQAKGYLVESPE